MKFRVSLEQGKVGKHVAYQARVENGHSFIELVDMHLALGEGN
jgi:hypothetical protein